MLSLSLSLAFGLGDPKARRRLEASALLFEDDELNRRSQVLTIASRRAHDLKLITFEAGSQLMFHVRAAHELALVRDADDNSLPRDYAAVAPKAEGSLHAGALRCTEHEALCAAHADAKWLVYAYSSEGKKAPPTTAASAAAALREATETVPDRAVRDLGPAQIDSIMSQAADEGASRARTVTRPSLGALSFSSPLSSCFLSVRASREQRQNLPSRYHQEG